MSNISKIVDGILSKDFIAADKLFEEEMAKRVMTGFALTEEYIQEQVAADNPELFKQLDEVVDDSPLDAAIKDDHAPVEAPISEPIPEPVDVDGHRKADHDEEESEEVYEQFAVESHDFDEDRADEEENPENVGAEPVGDPVANQGSIAMKPSDASPAQLEESKKGGKGRTAKMAAAGLGGAALGAGGVAGAIKLADRMKPRQFPPGLSPDRPYKIVGKVVEGTEEQEVEEELTAKQKKIDVNKNGKIDGEDLKALRNESLDHSGVCETCGEEGHMKEECNG